MEDYLKPTYFIDSDSEIVKSFVSSCITQEDSYIEKVKKLFLKVRDNILYDPYRIDLHKESMRASSVIQKGFGYCVTKAVLLTAVMRSAGIPSRLGFANVTNHINSKRLRAIMKSDIFIFHGYSYIYANNNWWKATPAFNIALCNKANIQPVDFDGTKDAIFHPYDKNGKLHLEYLLDHGPFDDLPYERILDEYEIHYPHTHARKTLSFSLSQVKEYKFEEEIEQV